MTANATRLVVFSAHAADFCSRSGGTVATYTRQGCPVHIVDVTYGERGESEGYWIEHPSDGSIAEVKKLRAAEAEAASSVLGATIEFLDYGDYPLVIDQARLETLARLIRQHTPNIILTHWKRDPCNLDHQVLANAVLRAATVAATPGFDEDPKHLHPSMHSTPHIFFFEPTVPRDDFSGFVPNTYIDIDDVFETKIKALQALHSQPKLVPWYTQWAEYRGAQARQWSGQSVKYAEAFFRYTAAVGTHLPI